MLSFKVVVTAVAVLVVLGQQVLAMGVTAQPQLEVEVEWSGGRPDLEWWGDAKVSLLSDGLPSPEEMKGLLLQAIQEAVNRLPFAVSSWRLKVEFFKNQERIAGTHVHAYNSWLDPIVVAGILIGRGLTGGCEEEFLIKHKTYLATGAPVEVSYKACRYGSGPKMKALLGLGSQEASTKEVQDALTFGKPSQEDVQAFLLGSLLLLIAFAVALAVIWIFGK
jgi:hypothetical protein